MSRRLLLPYQISKILKEILNKLYCLNDVKEGSSEFLEYLSSLAALLGDEVVVDGLAIAESYGVTYHYDERMTVEHVKRSDACRTNSKEVMDVVDPFALDDLLDDNVALEENYANFGVLDKKDDSFSRIDVQEKPRNDSNDSSDIFSDHTENTPGYETFPVKEEMNIVKVEIEDNGFQEASESNNDALSFYEVIFSLNVQKTCFIMPDINFCCCKRFQDDVIENEKEYTCCHVIATWLARALGTIQNIPERPESLRTLSLGDDMNGDRTCFERNKTDVKGLGLLL